MIRPSLTAAFFLSFAAAPAVGAPSLAGTWFGTGEPYDKSEMYLDHFLPNGELHSQFRACHNGKATTNSTEDGSWSVAGNILTIHMEKHDGMPAPRVDVYRWIWSPRSASRTSICR